MNGGSGGNRARTRVLIADDQEMVRTGFRLILGTQPDLEVIGEAADGAECVELARRLRPDVCLVDIRSPNWTAWRSPVPWPVRVSRTRCASS
ncbi:hypothetical protein SSP24_64630 [Streptomyces spinoverrucosus]|uniref:Response regulatory domain-containing protein n=1 Tax=Streptomyces spinoverrucosus TaxID=284043 RepID=A0A4Y3VRI6_9ACTN|nr:hypothetical protein SSP24_64630 [Streptomyces spinoverrucosus]GHB88760.1 hypothetical protein GCM10010397_70860 [Streptomyces spinoverrucosus]